MSKLTRVLGLFVVILLFYVIHEYTDVLKNEEENAEAGAGKEEAGAGKEEAGGGKADCSGCLGGHATCTDACVSGGHGTTGTCAHPGSTDTGKCCSCHGALPEEGKPAAASTIDQCGLGEIIKDSKCESLPTNIAVSCISNDVGKGKNAAIYRSVGNGTLSWYPNATVADSWDSNWRSHQKIDCANFSLGPDMTERVAPVQNPGDGGVVEDNSTPESRGEMGCENCSSVLDINCQWNCRF